jgi:hypothetical protein
VLERVARVIDPVASQEYELGFTDGFTYEIGHRQMTVYGRHSDTGLEPNTAVPRPSANARLLCGFVFEIHPAGNRQTEDGLRIGSDLRF